MDVIKYSQKTKQEADELLMYGNVMKVLSKYGEVFITGSYKYDLMYGPDIDLVVLSDTPEKSSYNALLDFIDQRKFQKYQLGDFKRYPRENRPKAIIVVLIHEFKDRRWEIEVWFDKELPEGDVNPELEDMLLNVSNKNKKTILSLKHRREIDNTSKHKLDSTTIYKGVLLDGKVKLEDFRS